MTIVKYILPKLIKKNIKIFISLILIAALGMGLPMGLLNSYNGVLYSFEKYFEEYGFPDVTIMSAALFGEEKLNTAGELSGIDDVQGRLCVDVEAAKGEDTFVSLRCYSIGETDFMNIIR